ncbi:hypothetical protein [Salinicola halimionae]|uniref:hypothetical protein n=1 Tax=Salinicola halimionae TaxID=1949081 RepID=UPI000DA244F9|nr:hypothetical protein [Salinicola halimionae]
MRPDSRIILILGLGGDMESDFVQALADEKDTLLLQAPFGSSFSSSGFGSSSGRSRSHSADIASSSSFGTGLDMPCSCVIGALPESSTALDAALEEAHSYFAGSPAVQSLRIEDVGALQRVTEAIGERHGRLDVLILGSCLGLTDSRVGLTDSRVGLADSTGMAAWQRLVQPYHFDRLAPIVTCLPLLMKAPAGRIIDLQAAGTELDLSPLLAGTPIDVERVSLSPSAVDKSEDGYHKTAVRDATGLTTL